MPQLWQSVRFHAEAHKMLWIPQLCCCSKSSNINTILFSHTSGCHSDKASPCALHPEVNLKGCKQPECDSGGGNVPPRSAAGLTALACWQLPMEEISWLLFWSWMLHVPFLTSLLRMFFIPSHISSGSISPTVQVVSHICVSLQLCLGFPQEVWGRTGGGGVRTKSGQGLHFVILLL